MKVFVYEWVCGGGYLDRSDALPPSLRREGAAMLAAVAGDFAQVPGVDVLTIVDPAYQVQRASPVRFHRAANAEERDRLFGQLSSEADYTVVIAPEFAGVLLRLSRCVLQFGGRLLSPNPAVVEIASDKQSTAEFMHAAGIRVPRGSVVLPGERCPAAYSYPAVLKPVDGCGSIGIRRIEEQAVVPAQSAAYRLEEFVAGQAVSVAVIRGGEQAVALEPCTQKLTDDDNFAYAGGQLPLPSALRQRASRLATAAVEALPPSLGYLGVDMVLGGPEDGSQDTVIELNPRYTTSYVGLRAATDTNLAAICLGLASGDAVSRPSFDRAVAWDAAGNCWAVSQEASC